MYISLFSACGLGITDDDNTNLNLNLNTNANTKTESREKEFKLGGQTIGLNGTLILKNGDQQIELNKNSSFFFEGNITSGNEFAISIESQPQNQTCLLQNANGIITASNVTSVVIVCVNSEILTAPVVVKGNASGLAESVTLTAANGSTFSILQNGAFEFQFASTEQLIPLTITQQPAQQNCQISNISAIEASTTQVSFEVSCADINIINPLNVQVSASGLTGPVTVTTKDGNTLSIPQNGKSSFELQSAALDIIPLTITQKPATQNCQVLNLSTIDATTTQVSFDLSCADIAAADFAIRVQATALHTPYSITLNNNEVLQLNLPGVYEFNTRLQPQENYNVVISTNQDPKQTCELGNANGQVIDNDILIQLQCEPLLTAKALPWDGQVQVSWNDVGADQYILHYAPNRDLNTTNSIPLNGFSIGDAYSPTVIENLPNNVLGFFIVEAVFSATDSLTSKVNARPNKIALDGDVSALAVADDGRVYVGGAFEHYSLRIADFAGLRIDATTPTDFIPVIAPDLAGGSITAIVKDNQDGYFIAGGFTSIDGVPRVNLARLHADGALDLQWQAPTINGAVTALAFYNNVLYIGGTFTEIDGNTRNYLAALNANAQLTDFAHELPGRISHFAHNGNELYVAGFFFPVSQQDYNYVSMISLDNSKLIWTHSFENFVWDIAYANDSIFVAGTYRTEQGNLQYLTAFNANGIYQTNFAPEFIPNTVGSIRAIASDGSNLYVAGVFNNINQQPRGGLAAFDANKQLLPWAPVINDAVNSLAVSNNGDIYIAGRFGAINDKPRFKLAAVDNNNGNLLDWNPDLVSIGGVFTEIQEITIIDNLLFMTGNSNFGLMKQAIPHLAAFESDGQLANWNPAITLGDKQKPVTSFNIDNDTIYVGGNFREINGQARTHLAAITSAGELVDDFAPTVTNNEGSSDISSIVLHNSELYIAGKFLQINDVDRINLAAIDLTGVLTNWTPSEQPDTYQLATNFNAGLYVGGTFSGIAGQERKLLARFNAAGELDLDFVPEELPATIIYANTVDAIALGNDNSRYVAYSNGFPAYSTVIAELDNTGQIVWQISRPTGKIQQLLVNSDAIYTAGSFTWQVSGVTHEIVAALSRTNPPELLDWNPKLMPYFQTFNVNAMAAYAQTIYLGGHFVTSNGVKSIHLAAVDKNTGETQKWPIFPPPW